MTVVKASDLPLLGATKIAELLDIPEATVRQYTREGRIPCIRIGRHVKYSLDSVVEAVQKAEDSGMPL